MAEHLSSKFYIELFIFNGQGNKTYNGKQLINENKFSDIKNTLKCIPEELNGFWKMIIKLPFKIDQNDLLD